MANVVVGDLTVTMVDATQVLWRMVLIVFLAAAVPNSDSILKKALKPVR